MNHNPRDVSQKVESNLSRDELDGLKSLKKNIKAG